MALATAEDFYTILKYGQNVARKRKRKVPVSFVREVSKVNPLSFFAASRKNYHGTRVFWQDAAGKVTFCTAGVCERLTSCGNGRFRMLSKKWQTFVADCVHMKETAVPLTGPLAFGGFSFAAEMGCDESWEDFSAADFIVPSYILTKMNGRTWLTVNTWIDARDNLAKKIAAIQRNERNLLAYNDPKRFNGPQRTETKEIALNRWMESVQSVVDEIKEDKKLKKVVLSRRLHVFGDADWQVEDVFMRLQTQQPGCFRFVFERGNRCFLGASPERLIKRWQNRVLTACLAGSVRRGKTKEEDEALGRYLLSDRKNLHEHRLVVDMIEKLIASVCRRWSVPNEPVLYQLKQIQHLYTPIEGEVAQETLIFDLLQALHPTPALGGYPRQAALSKIKEAEIHERGWYAAPVGWLDDSGNGEFVAAIRSALLHGPEAILFAGCGIVKGSDPQAEYEETSLKFRPMLSALGVEQQ